MTPQQRAYKILEDSGVITNPYEEEKVNYFLESARDCTWENPTNKIEERQFETSLKGWFKEFISELIEFAKKSPPTFEGLEYKLKDVGLHTMDDQGFEGQIMSDGSYLRIIQDFIQTQDNLICDFDDEENFQCTTQAKMIQLGYVLDFDYKWHKKSEIAAEKIMLEYVDWHHVHNSEKCSKVRKFYEDEKEEKKKSKMDLDKAISEFYEECNHLGFSYRCKTHNHLNNKDEYMKMHLFDEHHISIPFQNWEVWFTLFSVGDSYSSDYRCKICENEFLFESDAKKHILEHGIELEEEN